MWDHKKRSKKYGKVDKKNKSATSLFFLSRAFCASLSERNQHSDNAREREKEYVKKK